jgi:hypothetical protein
LRQAGDVSTWSRQAFGNPDPHRVANGHHHNWDFRSRILCRQRVDRNGCNDDFDLLSNKISHQLGQTLVLALGIAILNREIPSIDPSSIA